MLQFQPNSPFPLLLPRDYTEEEALSHSEKVDAWIGFRTKEIEGSLMEKGCRLRAPTQSQDRQEIWLGLAIKSLMTPYVEIRRILEKQNIRQGQTVVDLGTAYGRMAFVMGMHFPYAHFVGYEFAGERIQEGQRCLRKFFYDNCKLVHADLSSPDFSPIPADIYFIYDYGTSRSIEKTLYDLKRIARHRVFTLIARGQRCQEAIQNRHSWLQPVSREEGIKESLIFRSLPVLERFTPKDAPNSAKVIGL